MKLLVVFACVFLSANAELDKEFVEKFMEELQQVGEKCVEETGASQDDIAELLAHKVPSTHEGKCMIFCFHKHFHVLNTDGTLDPVGAINSLEPLKAQDADMYGKFVKVFQACASTPINSDPCLTAAALAKCAEEEGKKEGLTADMFEM